MLEWDVTQQEQAAAVECRVAELVQLDTLVNNADVMLLGLAAGVPLAEWQQMVELNLLGLLYWRTPRCPICCALPRMAHAR